MVVVGDRDPDHGDVLIGMDGKLGAMVVGMVLTALAIAPPLVPVPEVRGPVIAPG